MNVRKPGLIVLAALAGATACKDNPTSAGSGTAVAVMANFSSVTLHGVGSSGTVTAEIVDSRLTPLGGAISFSTCNANIVTIATDPTYQPVPATSSRAVLNGVSLNKSCVVISASGLKPDTVTVLVMPTYLPATLSSLTPKGGDTLTVTTTNPLLPLDTANLGVTFPGGVAGVILSKSTTSFKALIPFSAPGKTDSIRVSGVNVTYAGVDNNLATPGVFIQTGDFWAGDSSFATAPDLGGSIPSVAGDSSIVFFTTTPASNAAICGEGPGGGSSGPCMIFKVTVPTADSVTFTLAWPSGDAGFNPDIDTYFCTAPSAASCFSPGGGAGASVANPETITVKLAPGTYYWVAEYFAACDDSPTSKCGGNGVVNTYTLSITKH